MNALKSALTYSSSTPHPFPTTFPSELQPPAMQGLPTPPLSIAYDVNEFRRFFQFGLSQLRYNNKYIINDLTTLASVYHLRMSTYIVKDIELHLRESHPSHRLIGFYVIDSICKNLGHPFPELFKPSIERLFLTAYRDIEELDPIVKVKFEELLGTWRTGSVNQNELFGAEVQRRIEDGVFGAWRRGGVMFDSQAFLNGIKQQPAVATPVEKASILYDLRRILCERERIAATYPNDQANLAQMVTLQQLEQLVANQQLTISQVEEIRQQLQPLKPPTPPPVPVESRLGHNLPPAMSQLVVPQPQPPSQHQHQPHYYSQQAADLTDPSSLANLTRLLETNPSILLQAAQQSHHIPVVPSPLNNQVITSPQFALDSATQHALGAVAHLHHTSAPELVHTLPQTNLYDSEQLAAALASLNSQATIDCPSEVPSRERSTELTNQHSPAPSTLSTSDAVAYQHPDPAVMEYENMIAGFDIELRSASINRAKPADLVEVLYSRIPQFCRQDGSRFLYGKTGDQRASEQLDWHFRLQRRVRESGQRAQQRMWSQLEAHWLESHDFGVSRTGEGSKGKSNDISGMVKKKNGSKSDEKSIVDLKKKFVIRPCSPELASRPCPICREGFETRFDEDEDEFYWINAIESSKEPGKTVVYHATCYYETIRNKARMKMRNELEENRLKRIVEEKEEAKKKASLSSNVTPPMAVEENLLQEDESFFGHKQVGMVSPPKIKLEPTSPPPTTTLSLNTAPVIENSSSSLGKRKQPSPFHEIDPREHKAEKFPSHELNKKTKTD